MNQFNRRFATLALLALAGCSGGGGGGSSGTAPSNLVYPHTTEALIVDVAATPNVPTFAGSPSTFSVLPSLPAGVTLDVHTGAIGGTPTQAAAQTGYVLRATNGAGFTTTTVTLGVSLAPRFAYVANQSDSTISLLRDDAATGDLNHVGYIHAPPSQVGPERIAVHPSGNFVYVPNMGTSNLSVYSVNSADGWLTPGTPVALGAGPHGIAIDPNGTYLYVCSQNADQLQVFSIDPGTGALSVVQSISTGVQPSSCVVDPLGRFLFVTLHGNPTTGQGSALQAYLIDAPTGSVTAPSPAATLNGSQPTDVVVAPNGTAVFTTGERFNLVIPIRYDGVSGALTVLTARHAGSRPTALTIEPTGRFVYVTNQTDSTVSSFVADPATGDLTVVGTVGTGTNPTAVASDAGGRFVYIACSGTQTLTQYAIDDATGTLSPSDGGAATRAAPSGVGFAKGTSKLAVVPRFVHVAAASSNEVPAYTINATNGALTELPNPPLTQTRPVTVATDPRHRFLYVANQTGQTIDAFTINAGTGALASVGLPTPVTGAPTHAIVDPSGRFLYLTTRDVVVANDGWVTTYVISQNDGSLSPADTHQVTDRALWVTPDPTGEVIYVASNPGGAGTARISTLRVDPSNGALTLSPNPPASAAGVVALGFHPRRRVLYSVLSSANAVVSFSTDPATGEPTVIPGGAGNSGVSPSAVTISPDGRFGYVSYLEPAGTGHVSAFAVDPVTGKLLVPAVQYSDGLHPTDLAIDGSGRFLYSANSGSNTISVFQVDPVTGALNIRTPAASGLEPNALVVTTITQ